MPDESHFRDVMAHFTTGVTVVTSLAPDGRLCGLTVNSVASVSLKPLLVLVCVDRRAASHDCIAASGAFAVSVLGRPHEGLARRFSLGAHSDRFEELNYRIEVTGSPVLEDALAWFDCQVTEVHQGGDHSIVLGEVVACDAQEGEPLVFFRGGYRGIGP